MRNKKTLLCILVFLLCVAGAFLFYVERLAQGGKGKAMAAIPMRDIPVVTPDELPKLEEECRAQSKGEYQQYRLVTGELKTFRITRWSGGPAKRDFPAPPGWIESIEGARNVIIMEIIDNNIWSGGSPLSLEYIDEILTLRAIPLKAGERYAICAFLKQYFRPDGSRPYLIKYFRDKGSLEIRRISECWLCIF